MKKIQCRAVVVQSLTGENTDEALLPLSDDMICLSNIDNLPPTVLVKGLDQLVSEDSLSVGAATEIQTHLASKSIKWNPFVV